MAMQIRQKEFLFSHVALACSLLVLLAFRCLAQDALENERKFYDKVYSSQPEFFSAAPNAFLVRIMSDRRPGTALDVGMGQGRNAIWLAERGWNVTGFDISPV